MDILRDTSCISSNGYVLSGHFYHPAQSVAKFCKVQNCAMCQIMQCAESCNVTNYAECKIGAKCKIMQSAKWCKVQNYANCKGVQCAKSCKL